MPKVLVSNPPRSRRRKSKGTKARRRRRSTASRTRTVYVGRKTTRRRRRGGGVSSRGFITRDLVLGIAGGVTSMVAVPILVNKFGGKLADTPGKQVAATAAANLGLAFAAHKMRLRPLSQGILLGGGTAVASFGVSKLLTKPAGTVKGMGSLVQADGMGSLIDVSQSYNYPRLTA